MRSGVAGFQAERLAQAREARGLTKIALAQLINGSASSVTRWEQGEQLPETAQLESLSQALGVAPSWFLRALPDYGSKPYFFRDNTAITKEARTIATRRLQWVMDTALEVQEWVEWPTVNLPTAPVRDCRELTDNDIESLALECRKIWGLGLGPIADVLLTLENAGIVCAREYIGHTRMDGLSHWSAADNRPYVYLVADKANAIRGRWDAGHELGHLVLHSSIENTEFDKRNKEIERQAHLFAAAFLLPAESFAAEVSWPSLDTFLALKPRWKISVKAMIMRCKDLGIIGDEYSVRLYKNYSARGWNRGEPLDDDYNFEPTRLLSRAVNLLVSERLHTRDGLLRHLGLNSSDASSLLGLPNDFFDQRPGDVVTLDRVRLKKSVSSAPSGGGKVVRFKD